MTTRRTRPRQATGSGVGRVVLIVVVLALVVAGGAWWFFTQRTDPEVTRVEAEYSEVLDDLDHIGKQLEPYSKRKLDHLDPGMLVNLERAEKLADRKRDLEHQFYKKYGRMPRYVPINKRDYRSTPIR